MSRGVGTKVWVPKYKVWRDARSVVVVLANYGHLHAYSIEIIATKSIV